MIAILLCFQVLIQWVTAATVAPTWVTSSFVKAGQGNLINYVLTGKSASPTATMTFSSAFSAVPNLGYGIINSEGKI